ncbi:MAG: 2-dehydropantoate 2-reductase [Anaerolinea sp.]|nr:2-dehydropantoate 2-reductase [Anaerolinea sp.]
MRFVIFGAGGVGCTIGGQLYRSGHDVLLIARGAHLRSIQSSGLLLRTPAGDHRLQVPAVGHPREVEWREGDIAILTMKTQDTEAALRDLELAAGTAVPVVCAQNGIENERMAARRFDDVSAMLIALPATFLEPGVVIASAAPFSGVLHTGRYPSGATAVSQALSTALRQSNFLCDAEPNVMPFKHRKLLMNLANGLEIITGNKAWEAAGHMGELGQILRNEGAACFEAAGMKYTSLEEYTARVNGNYKSLPIDGQARSASSSLQSILRGHQTVETDYLNGEIELLGRLHGVPTPYNSAVRQLAVKVAAEGIPPGTLTLDDIEAAARRTLYA